MDFNLAGMSGPANEAGEEKVKVLVLGSGPAGLSAALYAARADLQPLVLTGMEMGGQVSLTHTVENYPGFPDGVGGTELVQLFQKQAEKFGARVEFDTAVEVDLSQRPFRVKTYNAAYLADTLIIATGAASTHLNVSGEKELTGRGVSYCATCDGWFFKEKDVVVVGGGDSALEEGLFLTRYANSVKIVHRRDQLRASAVLQDRARTNPKVSFIWDSVVEEIAGNGSVNAVKLKNVKTGERNEQTTDGVFIFIGHTPNTQLFKGQLEMDDQNYIKVNHLMQTSVSGVYAAGEVADPHFRQVITSAGMGAAAAMQAIHFIDNLSD
jgi:thioredoxin reductase (NADPH)